MKLFCFAYAGGDGHIFYPLATKLKSSNIEIVPLYYKGRGGRQDEGHYESIMEIAMEAADFIEEQGISGGYALLGHSMGGLVAYECYYELTRRRIELPCEIYFSGSLPPDRLIQNRFVDEDEEGVIDKLKLLGGMDPEILEIPEFKDFFVPIIKNDVKIYEEYVFKEKDENIDVPITILTGSLDEIRGKEVAGWKNHTKTPPKFMELSGNHFFLFNGEQNYKEIFNNLIR